MFINTEQWYQVALWFKLKNHKNIFLISLLIFFPSECSSLKCMRLNGYKTYQQFLKAVKVCWIKVLLIIKGKKKITPFEKFLWKLAVWVFCQNITWRGNWNDSLEYFLIQMYSQGWTEDLSKQVKFPVSQRSNYCPHSLLASMKDIYA